MKELSCKRSEISRCSCLSSSPSPLNQTTTYQDALVQLAFKSELFRWRDSPLVGSFHVVLLRLRWKSFQFFFRFQFIRNWWQVEVSQPCTQSLGVEVYRSTEQITFTKSPSMSFNIKILTYHLFLQFFVYQIHLQFRFN